MGAPVATRSGIRAGEERIIDMGELSEVTPRKKPLASSRGSGASVNFPKNAPTLTVPAPSTVTESTTVVKKASPHKEVVTRIRRLTYVACGLWLTGTVAGFLGATVGVEIGLDLSAFAILGWGLWTARKRLNQPQVNVVRKQEIQSIQ